MRLRHLLVSCAVALIALPDPAAAQHRQPIAGAPAVGGNVGFAVADEEFHVGFSPEVYGEFYLTRHLSLRVLGGWSRNEFIDYDQRYLEQFRGSVNAVYNWEEGLWHPFVTGGVGGHTIRTYIDDVENAQWHTQPALNAGVGIEFFARRRISVKAEGTYYWVPDRRKPEESSTFVISLGIKKYF